METIMIGMNSLAAMPPPVSSPGTIEGVLNLLQMLSDPAGSKKALNELIAARDEAVAATKSFGDAKAKADELDQRAATLIGSETSLAEARRELQRQRDELASERAEHAAEVERHRAAVDQLAAERATHERAVGQYRNQVAALRQAVASA
jgi:chromosome segregation ATPase